MGRGREETGGGWGARRVAGLALMLAGVVFFTPLLTVRGDPIWAGSEGLPSGTLPIQWDIQSATRDKGRVVRLAMPDGSVQSMTMEDYLFSVVAAEMPAQFELEALKAQACAARTYTVGKQLSASSNHPDADVCTDTACCQAYISPEEAAANWGDQAEEYAQKIRQAVSETDGLGVLYEGSPIQAVFFSSAPGYTVDAVEVWGNQVDYLTSVASPEGEEVPNYHSQVTLTREQVEQAVLNAYPGADLSGEPESWFGQPATNQGGTVTSIPVGGITLTGSQVRTLFSLRSACFTVSWDGQQFVFSVTGYGHGVGMSQYGANAMAKQGSGFEDILTWYYSGTQVDALW